MAKIVFDEREQESLGDKEGLIKMGTTTLKPKETINILAKKDKGDNILFGLINPDRKYEHEYIILAYPKDIHSFPKKYKD